MSATADNKFTEIDVDSDGKLTAEELKVAHVEGDFEMMDENGDSYVTRMEYRATSKVLSLNRRSPLVK